MKETISRVVISSILGHSGGGMFPLTLLPSYRQLMRAVQEAKVVSLTKSSTIFKNIGNFSLYNPRTWTCIQKIGQNGLLNAYGLTNNGIFVNAPLIASAQYRGFMIVPNFYPQFVKGQDEAIADTTLACQVYQYFLEEFSTLELNFSCPNSKEKIQENMTDGVACAKAIKQAFPKICLIAKISYVHPFEFAQELERIGVDIIHAINAIPYDLIYSNNVSPLEKIGGGGVSGGPAKIMALEYNRSLRKTLRVPMIMGCGIMTIDDAQAYFDAGANSISLCTVCRLNPREAKRIIEYYQ